MTRHVLESLFLLLRSEFVMSFCSFKALYEHVQKQTVYPCSSSHDVSPEQLCRAVDIACVLYFKPVLCLQRSSATTVLLRRHGSSAEMVIGAQMIPYAFHAWVEIDRVVVNDRPYMLDMYQVLERC